MTNLFKKLVFTDKAIDDLTVAVQAGKSITVERAVLSGWNPPDDDQVYTPYKNSSGVLDVAAVKANINKYFDKNEALKNTAPAWVEGILKPKTVKQKNKNTLNFALDFENTDFDHDVAAKYYGYTSWAELLDDMSEFNIDAQSVALLAQDDTGLEYVFAFAKIESDDSLKYPAALTTELTHKLHIDLFINITQSDNVVINYTPEGCVEYNEFEQHVELANNTYAKKVDVYTKIESDDKFLTKVEAAQKYATKEENAQKADKTSVYTKTETYNRTEIDDKAKGTIVINYDIDTKTPTKEVKQYNQRWLVDNGVLDGFADHINRLRGRNQLSNPDFNTVQTTGIYCITDLSDTDYTTKHAPVSNWGTLHVLCCGLDTTRLTQIYISDVNPAAGFYRSKMASGTWTEWQQIALKTDINNLENTKANKSDVYDKTTADGRFVRGAKVNDGPTVTPNSDGTLELNVPDPDLSNYYNKGEVDEKVNNAGKVKTVNNVSPDTSGNVTVNVGVKKVNNTAPDTSGNVATIQIFDSNAAARDYSAKHPNVLTGVLL